MSARSPGPQLRVDETIRSVHVVVAGRWSRASPGGKARVASVSLYIALACFPIVFVGELPDKTMFASLLMATRGRPLQVWIGAALAFVVHVAIAVTAGVALFALLPRQAVDAVVAAAFVAGAAYAWIASRHDREEGLDHLPRAGGVMLSAFVVIFVAEWGDLTQILTANLAARYGAPLSVGVGSVAALWAVAAIAVSGGSTLLRLVSVRRVRQVTSVVLLALAAYAAWSAAL